MAMSFFANDRTAVPQEALEGLSHAAVRSDDAV